MPKDSIIVIVIFVIEGIFSECKKRFQKKAKSEEFLYSPERPKSNNQRPTTNEKDQREAFKNQTLSKALIYCQKI